MIRTICGRKFKNVAQMALRDHETADRKAYMNAVKARVMESMGVEITFTNESEFIAELEKLGLVEPA